MSYLLAIFPPDRDISPIIDCFKQFDVQFQVQPTFEGLKPFAENYVAQQGLKVNIKENVEAFPDVSGRVVISEGGPIDDSLIFDNREPVRHSFDGQIVLSRGIIVNNELEDVEQEMNCSPRVKPEFNDNLVPVQTSRKRKWSSEVEANNYDVQDPEDAAESFLTFHAHLFLSNEDLVEKEVQDDEVGDFDDFTVDNADFMNAVDGYDCPVYGCSMKLSCTDELAEHMKDHSAPLLCGICKLSCRSGSHLRTHYRVHTGERPFKCDLCKSAFARKSNLIMHQRIHTGDHLYKCRVCEYKTNYPSTMKIHEQTHSQSRERPFICDVCGHTSFTSSHLKQHKRIHTGDRPYSCPTCPFKAATSSTLNRHKKTFSH